MNTSYKRYWEPSTVQALGASVTVGAVATTISYPFDFIKTRIQHRAEGYGIRQKNFQAGYSPNREFRLIHETGRGLSGFFVGLETALLGRSVHLLTRNLLYKIVYDRTKPVKPSNDLTNREKSLLASVSGGIAALVSNPFEVVLIRQQVDQALAADVRRNYTGFFQGYNKLVAQEGGSVALFRGAQASVMKAVALNTLLSAPYNAINESMWLTFEDTIWNRPVALVIATTVASLVAAPLDNIKTRLQKQFTDPTKNRLNYTGFLDCAEKILHHENIWSAYAGFYAFWMRTFVYASTTILLMDILTTRWKKQAGLKEWQI